jgi:hypothetical protein
VYKIIGSLQMLYISISNPTAWQTILLLYADSSSCRAAQWTKPQLNRLGSDAKQFLVTPPGPPGNHDERNLAMRRIEQDQLTRSILAKAHEKAAFTNLMILQ